MDDTKNCRLDPQLLWGKLDPQLLWGYWSVIDTEAELIFKKTTADLELTPDQVESFELFLKAMARFHFEVCSDMARFHFEVCSGLDDEENGKNIKGTEEEWQTVCSLYLTELKKKQRRR